MPQVNPLSLLAPSSGEDSYMTAEALKRRRLLAQSLMSGQGRPQATTRAGVLAKGLEGFMGGYAMRKANEKEAAQRQALANALKGALPEGQHGIADADPDFAKRLYAAQMQAKMAAEAEARRAAAEANKPGTMKAFIDGRDAIIETRGGRPVMNPDGTYKVVGSPKTDMLSKGAEGQKIRIAKAGRANTNITVGGTQIPKGFKPNPRAGMPGEPDALPITGTDKTKLPESMGGKVALAKLAIGKLDDVAKYAETGAMTGPMDHLTGTVLGYGKAGSMYRELHNGAEALVRVLTGAGMPESEARDRAKLYLPRMTDDATTLADKTRQLKERLTAVVDEVTRGRGGWTGEGEGPSRRGGEAKTPTMKRVPAPSGGDLKSIKEKWGLE